MSAVSINQMQAKIIRLCMASFLYFSSFALRIVNKKGEVSPLDLNDSQRYIHNRLEQQKRKLGWVRAAILKGRQQGASTYVSARYYKKSSFKRGMSVFILAHEVKTTQAIFDMVRRYYEQCPDWLKPFKGKDSIGQGMTFPNIDSSYKLGTAKNAQTGRGFTARLFHGSEVAFWQFASEILAGGLQAVPREKDTEIIFESTANGIGGEFSHHSRR